MEHKENGGVTKWGDTERSMQGTNETNNDRYVEIDIFKKLILFWKLFDVLTFQIFLRNSK